MFSDESVSFVSLSAVSKLVQIKLKLKRLNYRIL